MPHAKTKIGRR